ncbi:MAG: DUF6046 domain-containing protein [Chitinophagaceae bacterium]|nr:DUF6046 domain-containing protein [Chitinophagaceae bacterium]
MSDLINIIRRRVMPVFGAPVNVRIKTVKIPEMETLNQTANHLKGEWPLKLSLRDGRFFHFKIDPIISLNGGNVVSKREVSKGYIRGTVKERFTTEDWEIQISGFLKSDNGQYPQQEVKNLIEILSAPEAIKVENQLLLAFDIHYIVVEKYDFPHTAGSDRQAFDIKAFSDYDVPLFVKK